MLRFAAGLEKGAVSAYLGAVPLFANRDLAGTAVLATADGTLTKLTRLDVARTDDPAAETGATIGNAANDSAEPAVVAVIRLSPVTP